MLRKFLTGAVVLLIVSSSWGATKLSGKKQGAKIEEGDLIFKIYSDSQNKLKRAEKIYNSTGGPIILGGMMIERI